VSDIASTSSEGAAPIVDEVFTNEGGGSALYTVEQVRRTRELLSRIHAVRRAARYYPFDHPSVDAAIDALFLVLQRYSVEQVDVSLVFLDGEVLLGEQLLTEESLLFDQLVRELNAAGIGSLIMRKDATRSELARAMKIVSAEGDAIAGAGGADEMSTAADLTNTRVGGLVGVIPFENQAGGELTEDVRSAFSSAVALIREIDGSLAVGGMTSMKQVTGATKSLVDNVLSNRDAMLRMSAIKSQSEYTYYHSANVAILAVSLGSMVSRDPHFLSSLGAGALLHDIGKLDVGFEIIEKRGRLTDEEWEHVRQHPMLGARMASRMPGIDSAVLVPILEHHMAWDGSGYPSRTPRRKQHITSRIVAVADMYDAMTSARSYSTARAQDTAMRIIIESAGTSLDPALVRLFVPMMGAYPPRSVVALSNGSVGIVIAPSMHDAFRPTVRVLTDGAGALISPVDVALVERTDLSIQGIIDPRRINIDINDYL